MYIHVYICVCVPPPLHKPDPLLEDSKQESVYLYPFRRKVANWTLP